MREFHKKCVDEGALTQFAGVLALYCRPGATIYLYGNLGAGKTTFARGFLRALGFHGKVKSPTYTLVEPYEIDGKTIFHFDLYRVSHPDELHAMGIQEYFSGQAIMLVEWPDKGAPLLPPADLCCYIEFDHEGRDIILKATSSLGEAILDEFHAAQQKG